jgi:hypothetical protein
VLSSPFADACSGLGQACRFGHRTLRRHIGGRARESTSCDSGASPGRHMNEKELTNLRPAKRAMGGTDFSTWRRTFGPESHAGKSVRAGCGQCETFSERFSWTEVHSPCQTFDKNRKRGQMLETGWWDQAPPLRVMERLTIVLAKRLPVVRQVVKISRWFSVHRPWRRGPRRKP